MTKSLSGVPLDASRHRLSTHLRWMIGIRLVAITSLLLPYLLIQLSSGLEPGHFDFLYLFAGLTYGASLGYILLMRFGAPQLLQAWVQLVGDLALVSALVYYFGSASAFSVLYLPVIMTAATLLGFRAAITTSSTAWVLYALLAVASFEGWLPQPAAARAETLSIWLLLYKLAVHLFGFYGIAVLASKLTSGVTELELELEEKSEDLADLRVRHQDIVQSIPSGLLTTDEAGVITSLNRAGAEILGVEPTDFEGRAIDTTALFTKAQWERYTSNPELGRQRNELAWEQDDETRHIGFGVTRLASAEGSPSGWVLVFQDLTEWRALEEQIRLKDRMAAVGELAAGIAHELGNPLAAISGSVQMLSKGFDVETPQRKLLDIMQKESQRLNRTIKGFLQFARPKERSIVEFDISRLLEENLELLRNSQEVSSEHRLELELEPGSGRITADPDQISQLFWNLARNALRAMPEGGTLRVTGRRDGADYRLDFVDSGRGMTEEERRRIFHPFHAGFREGTGIGMSIVYRIVEEHGGRLEVDSAPGEGTTITVHLPATVRPAAPAAAGMTAEA
ncbi:MAG: ATP-binding protein [Thermoanaerobaculia bacterium]|nr:ATP-binding protein [Thermoanaerobaculia bacterium]